LGVELDIFQTATNPNTGGSAGTGILVGSATGVFSALDGVTNVKFTPPPNSVINSDGTFQFILPNGASQFPPGVWYILNQNDRLSASGPNATTSGIFLEVAELPVPSTASMGLAALGAVAAWRFASFSRRRGAAVA
jgi:hypothetical protein